MSEAAHNKIFRAEKTTRNRDDFKVMMVGSMIGILMLLVFPVWGTLYDQNFAPRPFVTATVEIVQTDQYEEPMLLYDADAKQPVTATWIAIIRDKNGNRLNSRRGQGNYSVREDNPRFWTWAAFFDTEDGTPPPAVPAQPFMVCLRYDSITPDTKVVDETPEMCSQVFHPGLGEVKIIEEEDL